MGNEFQCNAQIARNKSTFFGVDRSTNLRLDGRNMNCANLKFIFQAKLSKKKLLTNIGFCGNFHQYHFPDLNSQDLSKKLNLLQIKIPLEIQYFKLNCLINF